MKFICIGNQDNWGDDVIRPNVVEVTWRESNQDPDGLIDVELNESSFASFTMDAVTARYFAAEIIRLLGD